MCTLPATRVAKTDRGGEERNDTDFCICMCFAWQLQLMWSLTNLASSFVARVGKQASEWMGVIVAVMITNLSRVLSYECCRVCIKDLLCALKSLSSAGCDRSSSVLFLGFEEASLPLSLRRFLENRSSVWDYFFCSLRWPVW